MEFDEHVNAILGSCHADPFSILGIHPIKFENKDAVAVRVFLPGCKELYVVRKDEKKVYQCTRVRAEGFYEAIVEKQSDVFPYRLKAVLDDGKEIEYDDPYSFLPILSDFDLHLISEGTHYKKYEKLGAHIMEISGVKGVFFSVWAPNAARVSVIGDFNNWDGRRHQMRLRGIFGVWEIFIPALQEGDVYKFEIKGKHNNYIGIKADPYGFYAEVRPKSASIVYEINKYKWNDDRWMEERSKKNWMEEPCSTYEVHLSSWRQAEGDGIPRWLTYRELADQLVSYVSDLGYTHIELMPVTEHPLDASWGYQPVGYFAPTSRFGTPEDFMYFIDKCHQSNIGVIVDWVPAHFPRDSHGLSYFDGTALYEHADPRRGEHKEWGTLIFNYGRVEVTNFLIANALFWLDKYHLDGLRVDAVASMLYLDYSKKHGEWLPNQYGGKENLEAIAMLKRFNEVVHAYHPGVLTIAEESTAWPMVSRPTYLGGLGFSFKWNMGWMHDILLYFQKEPVHRRYHHNNLTFALLYAFTENFVNVLSHDEVVYLKRSMLDKMPGDMWQKFANLRLLYAYMYAQPGKKLLFMGGEFGQWKEWNFETSLDWHLLEYEPHRKLLNFMRDLNHIYKEERSLYEVDFSHEGFEWLDFNDYSNSIVSFMRKSKNTEEVMICIFNFTPVPRLNYRIGVPFEGFYKELLNSDSERYWGGNIGNWGGFHADHVWWQNRPFSLSVQLPPLGAVFFKHIKPVEISVEPVVEAVPIVEIKKEQPIEIKKEQLVEVKKEMPVEVKNEKPVEDKKESQVSVKKGDKGKNKK